MSRSLRPSASALALALAGALALGLASQAAQAGKAPWLHLRVANVDGTEKVNLNLPFSLVEGLLAMADEKELSADVGSNLPEGMSLADVRQMWKDLKSGGSQDFLSVVSGEETIRMAIDGELLRLRVSGLVEGLTTERVQVDVPTRLVDALLSGDAETLDLRAGLQELKRGAVGDILSIRNGFETVRLWIE